MRENRLKSWEVSASESLDSFAETFSQYASQRGIDSKYSLKQLVLYIPQTDVTQTFKKGLTPCLLVNMRRVKNEKIRITATLGIPRNYRLVMYFSVIITMICTHAPIDISLFILLMAVLIMHIFAGILNRLAYRSVNTLMAVVDSFVRAL